MTASLILPCSSLAMRSASSMSRVPNPCECGSAMLPCVVPECTNLVLELCGVSSVHWHSSAIHVEFPHDAGATFCAIFTHKLRAKRAFFGAFSQPKETTED